MGQGGPPQAPRRVTRGWRVAGRVQGVGFRYFVQRAATRLDLTGWVRNLPDGRVEVLGQGSAEALDELARALASGPPHAAVAGVTEWQISDEIEDHKAFDIR
ncbi:MAG: acylphosphatase [Gemmatimonadetes bacterium]|nr:acylphosphatase [Gemmatimonadota bacterium]MBK9691482.1 acylphosphatase [Gemmatimonadota bacterium]